MAPRSDTTAATTHIDGVLVVGGGYAGLHAARAVESAGHPVTVLDQRDTHDFITRLAGVAAGSASIDDARRPLRSFQSRVETGAVTGIGDGDVTLDDGRTLTADVVVVSAGARPARPPIDGIEHALPLRSAEDALTIRTALRTADAVVVIGGGATGVQFSAAAAHHRHDLDVHVVDGEARLLSPMSAATGTGARRILESRGVHLHLESLVERITVDGVDADGEHYSGLVIWAGGFEARADELGVDVTDEGRILIGEDLRLVGMDRTFAAGDIAAHLDGDGNSLPLSAQIAVQAGTAAGQNAARLLEGKELEHPTLTQRGWVLDLGGNRGLAEFGPIGLTRPFADLIPPILHKAVDLKTLFGMGGVPALRW